jgi:hypothetical protein
MPNPLIFRVIIISCNYTNYRKSENLKLMSHYYFFEYLGYNLFLMLQTNDSYSGNN